MNAENDMREQTKLPPLLGAAFPPNGIEAKHLPDLLALQAVIDAEIAPLAAENAATRHNRSPRSSARVS
jgi:hypothetical protein